LSPSDKSTPRNHLSHAPNPRVSQPIAEAPIPTSPHIHTPLHLILHHLLLLPPLRRLSPRILLFQLRQHKRAHSVDDAGKDGRALVQQPALGVGGVVGVDAAFEDGVLGYAEVAADGGHAGGWGERDREIG
jgi:hypothetical protein